MILVSGIMKIFQKVDNPNMKFKIKGVAIISAILLTAVSCKKQNFGDLAPPAGSYLLTCNQVTVANDTLSASCRKFNGQFVPTSLSALSQCLNQIVSGGDIGNLDGNLVCIPDLPKVASGFIFPETETNIDTWVTSADWDSMYEHSWGIWAGLTHFTGSVDGVQVRAFETWAIPDNMIYRTNVFNENQITGPVKRNRLRLMKPHQHSKQVPVETIANDGDTLIAVSIAYNPPAAKHAIDNKLFYKSTLAGYVQTGQQEIPNFPTNAITIKPVYKVITQSKIQNGIYKMPGWPGTPDPAKAFPEQDWDACVYIDISNTGAGGNEIDVGCSNRNANNTFYLNNFIHQTLTAEDATYLNKQLSLNAVEGDIAILVGMHVTTREIKRWVWQTYWWSANSDEPPLPSSTTIADKRPTVLDEAAGHYAMSVAYQMVIPTQPNNGGVSEGSSLIAYNPHLEAGFDMDIFQIVLPIVSNGKEVTNRYGVQTNCMTCHNLAMYDPNLDYNVNNGANRQKPYGTDYYMSLDDSVFNGSLRLDFAWSILGFMVEDK